MNREPELVLCVRNEGCAVWSHAGPIRVLLDQTAGEDGYLRVIDDSGEDYLYPTAYFVAVEFPGAVEKKLRIWHPIGQAR